MKLAILGDIHSNLINLEKALEKVKSIDIGHIIVVGDLQNLETIDIIVSTNKKISIVFGNADFDQDALLEGAKKYKNVEIFGDKGELKIEDKRIFFAHFPDVVRRAIENGSYDIAFSGHRHSPWEEKIGKTLYIRPGEVAGIYNPPTFCVFDTETMKAELVFINK